MGNETARQAAISFYKSVLQQRNLLAGFHQMLAGINIDRYRNIYVFWGLHFSTLARPPRLEDVTVLKALLFTWRISLRKALITEDAEMKRNFLPVLRFLAGQILFELHGNGLETLEDFDANAIVDVERGLPLVQQRNPFLEVSEFDEETLHE